MDIRTFQRGYDEAQAAIYNEAAGALPKFKPASVAEVARRAAAPDFDPNTRFYAIENSQPVAYAAFNRNGRVSFPWCRKGQESLAEPLFQHMLREMAKRGHHKAFAAYRGDWPVVLDFFRQQGFAVAREMVNFIVDVLDLPTIPRRSKSAVSPLQRSDVRQLITLAPHVVRCCGAEDLERYLFDNPHFPPNSLFALRSKDAILGAAILVHNDNYADARVVDAAMPCFRLGAFGTAGMQTKRINGVFSFLCRDDAQCGGIAVDLMEHASALLRDSEELTTLAAQCPSDAPHWLRFYQMTWRRQGSFPVLERELPR